MRIEIDGWRTGIRFSAAHFIPGHGKCSRLHGHDYGVRVVVEGELGEGHMLHDFLDLKKALRAVAEEMDHRVLLPSAGEDYRITREAGSVIVEHGGKRYVFPEEDVHFIEGKATTAECIASHIASRLREQLSFPPNISRVVVCVDEGPGQGACVEVEI